MFSLLLTMMMLGIIGMVILAGIVIAIHVALRVALFPLKLVLLPLKLLLLPIVAVVLLVKVVVLFSVGVVVLAVLVPIFIMVGLIAAPFLLLAAVVH